MVPAIKQDYAQIVVSDLEAKFVRHPMRFGRRIPTPHFCRLYATTVVFVGVIFVLGENARSFGDANPFANLSHENNLAANTVAVQGDHQVLVGTWKIVRFQDDGRDRLGRLGVRKKPRKGQMPRFAKLVITKDACWVIQGDGKREVRQGLSNCAWKSYKIDPTKNPKHIDVVGFAGKDGKKTRNYAGIYQVKGKTLRICWPEMGRRRPTKMESNGQMNLFVCERVSKKPEQLPK